MCVEGVATEDGVKEGLIFLNNTETAYWLIIISLRKGDSIFQIAPRKT